MNVSLLSAISGVLLLTTSCMYRPIVKDKSVTYDPSTGMKMDVYAPKKKGEAKEMMVFVHGGNWNSGKRNTYRYFGRKMARKGIVTAIIDYRLAYGTGFANMAEDVAMSVKYLQEHATEYNGDAKKTFVSGHSAGGHLAALVSLDDRYFKKAKVQYPAKGMILIDAFGLDIHDYLSRQEYATDSIYYPTFTKKPEKWTEGSPVHYLHKGMPQILMFTGEKTAVGITRDNYNFWSKAKDIQTGLKIITVPGKRHAGMIIQFVNSGNRNYDRILKFIHDPNMMTEQIIEM